MVPEVPRNIAWVHPSVRDVVIEYLAGHDAERSRFIKTAQIPGLLLALSNAGGSTGTRTRPLMKSDADWDALSGRIVEISTNAKARSLLDIIRGVRSALEVAYEANLTSIVGRLRDCARSILDAAKSSWVDPDSGTVEIALLGEYYRFSIGAKLLVESPPLNGTWDYYYERFVTAVTTGGIEHSENLDAVQNWLRLVLILQANEPRFLQISNYPNIATKLIEQLLINLRGRLDGMEEVDPNETTFDFDENGDYKDVPVELDPDEQDNLDWLNQIDGVIGLLGKVGVVASEVVEELWRAVRDHANAREMRKENWEEYQRDREEEDDDVDMYDRDIGPSEEFSVSGLFADL